MDTLSELKWYVARGMWQVRGRHECGKIEQKYTRVKYFEFLGLTLCLASHSMLEVMVVKIIPVLEMSEILFVKIVCILLTLLREYLFVVHMILIHL